MQAVPVFPGRSANSLWEADSGHPVTGEVSASTTGVKAAQTHPALARGEEIARATTEAQLRGLRQQPIRSPIAFTVLRLRGETSRRSARGTNSCGKCPQRSIR